MKTFQSTEMDETDWRILGELQADGRLSYKELGRRVHLSAPAIAERVRRLETAGVIAGYGANVDAAKAGQPLLAFLQLRCRPADCLLRTTSAEDYPEVVEVHKLSGEHCTMLKVRASSLGDLEGLIEKLGAHGEMRTHIVLSTQYDGRPVERREEERPITTAEGWAR
ncbi:Lrp/AsnC family transcriptional regulator [Microlunatus sp. GCM10028923]|uniref:Lrp/AsnC family transcriptional regulator n=1 Tax=Microlunatus sp. GCM10028923 TaxID=3273400 RepID=UPI0036153AD2